jgi:uncharacterized protein (DUF849 family)
LGLYLLRERVEARAVLVASDPNDARQAPVLLKAAINGARAAGSHPALPVSPEACALAAASSVAAGAGAVHVHVRGPDAAQSLDDVAVARTLAAIRRAVPGTPVGVSTLLSITGDPRSRQELVEGWSVLPDFASVNFNEEGSVDLAELLLERAVDVEAGLFDVAAARVCVESGLAPRCLRLMLEPRGGVLTDVLRSVDLMEEALDAAGADRPRLLHGSREVAWALIDEAARRGHQTRAGLEDTFTLPDGSPARDNAEIVAEAVRRIAAVPAGA